MRNLFTRLRGMRRATLVGLIAGVLAVGTGVGVGAAAVIGHSGTSITRVAVVTQTDAAVYSSAAWTNVGSLGIFAGAGQSIAVTFTAESVCSGAASGWCSIRVLIDGVEAEPVVGTDFAFNSPTTASQWRSLSVTRVKAVAASASHLVVVQAAVVGANLTHRLDDWSITAFAIAQ